MGDFPYFDGLYAIAHKENSILRHCGIFASLEGRHRLVQFMNTVPRAGPRFSPNKSKGIRVGGGGKGDGVRAIAHI